MKEGQNITYIHAPDKENFPDCDVAELVNVLNNVDSTRSGERHRIALALEDTSEASRIIEIDPAHGPIKHMCKLRDQGNTIIAKDGEKTVGMIGFQEYPRTPGGQRIFEIRRTTVLNDYRGGGIGRMLRESMIQRLEEIDSDAILLSRIHQDNEINRNLAESTQFTKISYEETRGLGIPEDWIQENKTTGYEYFVFDPRNKKKV